MLVGGALTVGLAAARVRFAQWPFHPVPFVVTSGDFVSFFWMPFMIAWVVKLLILHYRGRVGFQSALPFFFGLILGEMSGGMLWPLYGMLTGTPCYSFFGA